ncbi:MAG TPA: lytic murein transglycosylase, partial [Desulfomonilia bacterium]|nr:lytic murein transglycosylase [Desulfomonilia bacterium]
AQNLIGDPRLIFDPGFILKNLRISPPRASPKTPGIMEYDPVYVLRGRSFIDTNLKQFSLIQDRYGTSPEIITAILIVETRLGTYPMRYRAMRVFANMALAQDPLFIASLEGHYKGLSELLRDDAVLKVATAKAKWASGELFELIVLSRELGLDPHEIKGSVSGALGPAQFIPSTYRKYGVDGDGDGKKDPFNMADAMASIASYLKSSGWREDGDEQRRRTAIWRYNHSDIYVNTILKLYQELSGS